MKKLLFILFLLIPFLAQAQETQLARMNPYIAGSGTAAAAACSADSGDTYNQGFEAGTTPAGWTSAGTPNYGATNPTLTGCATCCSKSLLIDQDASTVTANYDEGTARTDVYYRFLMYVDSSHKTLDITYNVNFGAGADWASTACSLNILDLGADDLKLRLSGAVSSAYLSLTYDTWNRIEVRCVKNGTSTLKVNGTSNATDATAANYDLRYVSFGSYNNQTAKIYYDEFAISTTGWIGAP